VNGNNPVAMIFARKIDDSLTSLVKKLDKATAANKSSRMGSFVVFMSDDEGMEKKLTELAKKANLKNTILTLDNPSGPRGYSIAKDADVTVVLYTRRTVKVNHAYKKGEFTDKEVEKVIGELPMILPKK
jgi:hypothetical protein